MRTLVHVTHEAVQKVGGIGAVLHGLLTSRAYNNAVERTILIGPLFTTEGGPETRLGPTGQVLYSSLDGWTDHPAAPQFQKIQRDFNVEIVYGRRTFADRATGVQSSPEVVLIDVSRVNIARLNRFKGKLWEFFGLDSASYERYWEYDQYVKLAEPALAVVRALGACGANRECVIVAHEFMGMPTALAAIMEGRGTFRTVFYAHEVATIRKLVEDHPGHDTMFYNVLRAAMCRDQHLEDVFGSQHHYFKHALVEASKYCDNILAVGDYVVKELRFLGPEFEHVDIDLSYNGIPAYEISLEEALASKAKLQQYTKTLLDFVPDFIFTHVTRMVTSKGLWRDLRVLNHLERAFRRMDKTGIFFVLSSEVPRRQPEDIRNMERWWHWPVAHREGLPDLSGGEAMFYVGVQEFNARARNIKTILINQFGFDRTVCGERMPEDMEFMDIRKGTDVEFGQSIYEPFGIAQFEPLSVGGLCVVSNVCGCAGFLTNVTGGEPVPNVIIADYTDIGWPHGDVEELLKIDRQRRDEVEERVAQQVAQEILRRLPDTPAKKNDLLRSGYELARRMSWEVVAQDYFLPAIERACRKQRVYQVA